MPARPSSPPRRPLPARPPSGCTSPTGCSPRGASSRVAVVAPTTHICRQWALDAARYGIHLEPNRPNSRRARSRVTATASPSPTRRSPRAPGPPPALRRAPDAADRRRAAPHGRGRDVGAEDDRGVRAGAVPAAALGHAVPLGQLADPVGRLRRGRRLARGLRLRLHAGADRRRLPAGDVPHLRRRHGVGQRRAGAAGGLRRRPARSGGRAAAAHRAGPGGRLDHPRPARRRRGAARDPRRRPPRRGRAGRRDRQGARGEARRPAGADHGRPAGHRALRRGGRLGADRALLGRARRRGWCRC